MGTIEKAKFQIGKAWDNVQNLGDSFKGALGKVNGYVGTAFEVAKNGSTFIGINYSQIEPIRDSIRVYVAGIQAEVAKLNTEISNTNALKGQVAVDTKLYVEAVSKAANDYVSALKAYSVQMHDYGEAFKSNEANLSQNIADEAKALASSTEEYVEKY